MHTKFTKQKIISDLVYDIFQLMDRAYGLRIKSTLRRGKDNTSHCERKSLFLSAKKGEFAPELIKNEKSLARFKKRIRP